MVENFQKSVPKKMSPFWEKHKMINNKSTNNICFSFMLKLGTLEKEQNTIIERDEGEWISTQLLNL